MARFLEDGFARVWIDSAEADAIHAALSHEGVLETLAAIGRGLLLSPEQRELGKVLLGEEDV